MQHFNHDTQILHESAALSNIEIYVYFVRLPWLIPIPPLSPDNSPGRRKTRGYLLCCHDKSIRALLLLQIWNCIPNKTVSVSVPLLPLALASPLV